MFVRFSTVAGERGSTDTARDVRGFAVKFYTDEGNWDLVGNNMPVFFIQDAMKFPDLVHAVKPEPHHAMPQAASAHDTFWDFVSLMPEIDPHADVGDVRSRDPAQLPHDAGLRRAHVPPGQRARRSRVFVKFHWKPMAGTHSLVWDEAVKISGADPDFHRRDLWEAIEAGAYPEWELGMQIFTEEQAEAFSFDVLDATKIVPEELVPVEPGRPDGAQPQSGQLLRRDRAGGVLHRAHRARHRLLERPCEGDKVRGKPEKFAEHYNQATLFWNSQSPVEQAHIIRAFRFELTKVQVNAIRLRVIGRPRSPTSAQARRSSTPRPSTRTIPPKTFWTMPPRKAPSRSGQGTREAAREQGYPGERRGAGSRLDSFAAKRRANADKPPKFGADTPMGRPAQPAELAPLYVMLRSARSDLFHGDRFLGRSVDAAGLDDRLAGRDRTAPVLMGARAVKASAP